MPVGAHLDIMGEIINAQHRPQSTPKQIKSGPGLSGVSADRVRAFVDEPRTSDEVIADLRAENAALVELLSAERLEKEDALNALDIMSQGAIANIWLRMNGDGFNGPDSLNIGGNPC